jgi:hypothetical protein
MAYIDLMDLGFKDENEGAEEILRLRNRVVRLEYWLQWCMENCDDSPEYNFGTTATDEIYKLLADKLKPINI